ncbi:serine-rich adhesin for platelets-like isoform X2 [Dysidea avara]|uniref:serine-rich adhesin for platelets-like isoform X2 n=1 Tax=Dysidea avara TaxID=196820 RepID=UPI00332F3645
MFNMITGRSRFLMTVILLPVSVIGLTAAVCGPPPTVNVTCINREAKITWSHNCERQNGCEAYMTCINGYGTHTRESRSTCPTKGWTFLIPMEIYSCNISVHYGYKSSSGFTWSDYGFQTCTTGYSIDIQPVYNTTGSPLEIPCSVNTADITNSDDVTISWTGPNGTITNDNRLTITPTISDGTNHISTLQFSYLSEDDEGLYECSTTVLGYDENKTASVELTNLTIPTPNVIVTALNNQQVGDPLLLECNVTTVRGITSSVDIVWITNDTVVERDNNVSGKTVGNSVVYSFVYNRDGIPLREQDNRTVYQCNVQINTTPPVEANNLIIVGAFHISSIWPTSTTPPSYTSTAEAPFNTGMQPTSITTTRASSNTGIRPTNPNTAQASSNTDSSQSAIIISTIAVMITFIFVILIFGCFVYKQRRKLLARWSSAETTNNMVPPFEDDTDYSVIGKEAPSTCEYLDNEKVLHWIKDVKMPKIDEECVSIHSGETANVDMLNLVYGINAKADDDECGSSESISISKDPYFSESIAFRKNSSRSSSSYSDENSPTTSNGYVKVDTTLNGYYCEHSSDDQTQTTSTTTTSLEGSYTDHYSAHVVPLLSTKTVNDQTISDSCSTGDYCDYEHRIQDSNQTMSTIAASLEGSYIDHDSAQMGLISNTNHQDQTKTFPLSTTKEPNSIVIKDHCHSDVDDLPYVALSEDMLGCSISGRSSPVGDLDYSAYSVTTESDNNSVTSKNW